LRSIRKPLSLLIFSGIFICGNVLAEETKEELKPDGLWRGNAGLALTMSSGNTRSQSLSVNADAARKRIYDKWTLYAQALGARSDVAGQTTTSANQWSTGARYDHTIYKDLFWFGGLDLSRDQIKLLRLRGVGSAGVGYHLLGTSQTQWDLFGGASYRDDHYIDPGVLFYNQLRTRFKTGQLMGGEESTHELTDSTTFKQRFAVNRNMNKDGGYLATFDASLSVAINKKFSLKVSVQDKYDSLAEAPIKKNDVVFFTGVNVKFGG